MPCFYDLLGLSPSASSCEVRSAYRRQALKTHPDKGGSAEQFRQVLLAFETLSSSRGRAKYDLTLAKRRSRELRKDRKKGSSHAEPSAAAAKAAAGAAAGAEKCSGSAAGASPQSAGAETRTARPKKTEAAAREASVSAEGVGRAPTGAARDSSEARNAKEEAAEDRIARRKAPSQAAYRGLAACLIRLRRLANVMQRAERVSALQATPMPVRNELLMFMQAYGKFGMPPKPESHQAPQSNAATKDADTSSHQAGSVGESKEANAAHPEGAPGTGSQPADTPQREEQRQATPEEDALRCVNSDMDCDELSSSTSDDVLELSDDDEEAEDASSQSSSSEPEAVILSLEDFSKEADPTEEACETPMPKQDEENGGARKKEYRTTGIRGVTRRVDTRSRNIVISYQATITICYLVLRSRYVADIQLAIDYHIALMQFREEVAELLENSGEEGFDEAVLAVSEKRRSDVDEMQMSCYTNMRAFGAKIATLSTNSFAEALQHRTRLLAARSLSPSCFGDALIDILQTARTNVYKRCNQWSSMKAKEFVEKAMDTARQRRQNWEACKLVSQQRKQSAKLEKVQQGEQRKQKQAEKRSHAWRRTVKRAEKQLTRKKEKLQREMQRATTEQAKRQQEETRQMARQKRQEEAAVRQAEKRRRQSFNASYSRDMTFEEQQSYAARLRQQSTRPGPQ
eukprot:TRINITY_DN37906_c0_g1_i1.p1 TRINITY_DN37906_c0_g1~~TRINITY_DN37906_c0_g1_i1.p1  ORF type:complete len:722 (+),score=168.33 TRINITY_DN37906_c0_g1_i1:109-2166(+)